MALLGNSGVTGGSTRSLAGAVRAIRFTMPENGTLNSIIGSIQATGAHRIIALLYDASGNLLASSTVRTDISGSIVDETFTGFGSYSLTASTVYHAAILADPTDVAGVEFELGLTYDGYGDIATHDADAPPNPATITIDGGARDFGIWIDYTPVAGSVTKTPAQAVLTVNVLGPTTNAYTFVAIQDTLINESGQVVANAANIRLLVWYNGQAIGAPDYSVNGQTSNASGSISWSVTPGSLANGQAIFYLAQDSISYSNYTCGRVVPTYG